MSSTFQRDLADGKIAEAQMAAKLIKAGLYDDVRFIEGNFLFYDAIATKDGREEKLEMKNDKKSAQTGNFFVEFWCRDKHSGIAVTQADFYIVTTYNPLAVWRLPVKYLHALAKTCRTVHGGDNNVSHGYLVHVSKLAKEYQLP